MAVETGHNATMAVELGTPPVTGVFTDHPRADRRHHGVQRHPRLDAVHAARHDH